MVRPKRLVCKGFPLHVVHRGTRSQKVFFSDKDKAFYKRLLIDFSGRYGLNVWAYCLMDNHVHLIVVPENKKGLSTAMGMIAKTYASRINLREGWKGALWQGRFHSSIIMDERYMYAAVRYVERNPVRAGIVGSAEDFLFSSAPHHVNKCVDYVVSECYLTNEISDWSKYLSREDKKNELAEIRQQTKKGRPLAH